MVHQLDGGGDHGEPLGVGLVGELGDGSSSVEELDGGAVLGGRPLVEAEEVRGGGLGVEVDQQDPLALGGVDAGQVHRRGGLADASLVVGYGNRAHGNPFPSCIGVAGDVEVPRHRNLVSS